MSKFAHQAASANGVCEAIVSRTERRRPLESYIHGSAQEPARARCSTRWPMKNRLKVLSASGTARVGMLRIPLSIDLRGLGATLAWVVLNEARASIAR